MIRIKKFSRWFKQMGVGECLWISYATTPLLYLCILWPLSIKFNLLYLIPVGFVIHIIFVFWRLLQLEN